MEIRNPDGLPNEVIRKASLEIASMLKGWGRERSKRNPMSMFTREQFSQPTNREDALKAARTALRDDVVSVTLEILESLAIERVGWESDKADVSALWNITAERGKFDFYMRQAFWELCTTGVVTTATWWGETTHRPTGTGPTGTRKRRSSSLIIPQRTVVLPTEKIFRLETFWSVDKLVWVCEDEEERDRLASGEDETLKRLLLGPLVPSADEEKRLADADISAELCLLLDGDNVWQARLAGSDYGTGTVTPMTPVLPWLEQKARLVDADRASLIGAANFILVFKIGSDTRPAQDEEIGALQEGMTRIAKMPFIVGDHRLSVEILTPDTTAVLNSDKHGVINHRIAATVMGLPDDALLPGKPDPEIAARMMVARIKARRRILADAARLNLALQASDINGTPIEDAPAVSFMPRAIPLIGVTAAMNAALAARARRDLSRHTYLETLDYDHDVELERVRDEADSGADEVFQTHQPFDAQNTNGGTPPGAQGQTGGRPTGDKTKPGQGAPKQGGAST